MRAAWLVSVVGDPVYIPCKRCGTKVHPDTNKCKRAGTAACVSEPDSAARVLAGARIADWSGQVENVLIGGEHLAVLAKVVDEQQVAKVIEEKAMQALCFKGPFDVRLATAPHMIQGWQARQVGEPSATATPDCDPARARLAHAGFLFLAARPALGIDYNDSSRPI